MRFLAGLAITALVWALGFERVTLVLETLDSTLKATYGRLAPMIEPHPKPRHPEPKHAR